MICCRNLLGFTQCSSSSVPLAVCTISCISSIIQYVICMTSLMKMTFMIFHDGSDIAILIHCTPLWTFDVFLFGPAGVTSHGDSLGPGRPSESIRRFLCLGTAGSICLSLPRQTRTENRQEDCALAAVCGRNGQRAEHVKKI